jgi:hypothetical protein
MLELAEAHGIIVYLKTTFLDEDEAAEHRKNLKEDLAALDKELCQEYINNSTTDETSS